MDDEILSCIRAMNEEISGTIANLLRERDGLWAVEKMICTGGGRGVAHKCASGYMEDARDTCTNLSLSADRLLRKLSAMEGYRIWILKTL